MTPFQNLYKDKGNIYIIYIHYIYIHIYKSFHGVSFCPESKMIGGLWSVALWRGHWWRNHGGGQS